MKNKNQITEFCQKYGITENQFKGIDEYKGSLYLRSLTSIPEGFNPTVGGSLYLRSLTSIPEGFNPTVGGYLDLRSLTSISDGFNPTVGGSLYLSSLTSIPDGFNPTVGGDLDLESLTSIPDGFNKNYYQNKDIPFIKWGKGNGTHIFCDGRFSEVISKKGNVWKLKDVNKSNEYYLVTDGNGKFAHGNSIKEAKYDLIYKISDRDKSQYKTLDIEKKLPFDRCIEIYRVITGACSTGTKNFINANSIAAKKYSIKDMAKITNGQYGNNDFKQFFNI